jgi:anaerobic ribonucleoside-triphosphate reductase activating protein
MKDRYPNKTIWCYTGFTLDVEHACLKEIQKNTEVTQELLSLMDVLVDGAYVEELKDVRLKFRGSANQRIIDVKKTFEKGECVLYLE